ncbi:unnamed protein product [Clonostachys rosea]|uniref:Xylanolytic transcriptional activator regulatory domain-containing protein n=1 Tax=Bionectria ochroleuca TaxID=29856 RepID=A0ABY6UTL0_BIOOC|nr:unnamed protein product [Clonostachys rosea]
MDQTEDVEPSLDKADIPSYVNCEYDLTKSKPGVKAGAIGNLSRRIGKYLNHFAWYRQQRHGWLAYRSLATSDVLENALMSSDGRMPCCQHETLSQTTNGNPTTSNDVVKIVSLLAVELQKLSSRNQPAPPASFIGSQSYDGPFWRRHPPHSQSSDGCAADAYEHDECSPGSQGARKRRRVDSCGNPNVEPTRSLEEHFEDVASGLPQPKHLEAIINAYFYVIQPWIPILHETRFRLHILDPEYFSRVQVILHAMIVAALRYVNSVEFSLSVNQLNEKRIRSRRLVIVNAMDNLSIESLQALIIVAFTDISNGEASQAWSIIGSLTRTVEYLQLTIESDHQEDKPMLRPLSIVPPPQNWTEEEERRRVFWIIFSLDRWNTSLTSDDVRRRLPADGGLWHKEEGVTTPFFGIWNKSTAKIGKSIAFLPPDFPDPDQHDRDQSAADLPQDGGRHPAAMDKTTIGALAYRIEATESLSRVTTYFLQQNIDFCDKKQVSDWLMRFKELDLRLVHWKMFLPHQWKDSNISRQPDAINMDPNLTLAHVIHNTSMILLHQRIAYPDARWPGDLRLPSSCSAETCQVAAVETTSITQKYLNHTDKLGPVTDQYAFCIFISARALLSKSKTREGGEGGGEKTKYKIQMILPRAGEKERLDPKRADRVSVPVHHCHYHASLAPEFWVLIGALDEMARRWAGPRLQQDAPRSLAGKYAEQLRCLKAQSAASDKYVIDVLAYPDGATPGSPCSAFYPRPGEGDPPVRVGASDMGLMRPAAGQDGLPPPSAETYDGDWSAMSKFMSDQDFLNMDRVISLDNMVFTQPSIGTDDVTWAPSTTQLIG